MVFKIDSKVKRTDFILPEIIGTKNLLTEKNEIYRKKHLYRNPGQTGSYTGIILISAVLLFNSSSCYATDDVMLKAVDVIAMKKEFQYPWKILNPPSFKIAQFSAKFDPGKREIPC
ncbi:hypothetical protein GCM10008932_03930 [Alkalibacterium iburiense]|uniref:Uncharacterized protein n=1 Tax=Alkalibacterium iburiense TaxID=290589 RepID=A0ABN0X3G2_9LACT